jgi:xanthine/uracil/vitamin C permease (AzgA family)
MPLVALKCSAPAGRIAIPLRVRFIGKGPEMSFGIYALGYAILIAGLGYVAHLMHMPPRWIFGFALVFVGLGIMSAVKATRQKDPIR